MGGMLEPSAAPPREAWRLFPLVSVVAFIALTACLAYSSLEGTGSLLAAFPELRPFWLDAAAVFAAGAVAVAVLFGVDTARARRGGALRCPPQAVLVLGIALFGFGLTAMAVGREESYGRLPHGSGYAFLVSYVEGALLLFALGFLGHRASPRRVDAGARVLAAAHGLVGMGWGVLLAYTAVTTFPVAT